MRKMESRIGSRSQSEKAKDMCVVNTTQMFFTYFDSNADRMHKVGSG